MCELPRTEEPLPAGTAPGEREKVIGMVGGRMNPLQVAQPEVLIALFLAQTVILEPWRLRTLLGAFLNSLRSVISLCLTLCSQPTV